MQPLAAIPGVKRGCGYRITGGVYIETAVTTHGGKPIEEFLVDSPIPYEPDHKVGVELVPREEPDGTTVWHVLDWIGEEHYPHASDFIEECRRYGLSRRVPKSLDFSKLSKRSRILCVHRRAYLGNAEDYVEPIRAREEHGDLLGVGHCGLFAREQNDFHLRKPDVPCSRHWWHFAEPTAPVGVAGTAVRDFGSIDYTVYPFEDEDLPDPEWKSGLIASLPLTHISVIRSPGGDHEATLDDVREQEPGVDVDEAEA